MEKNSEGSVFVTVTAEAFSFLLIATIVELGVINMSCEWNYNSTDVTIQKPAYLAKSLFLLCDFKKYNLQMALNEAFNGLICINIRFFSLFLNDCAHTR